MFWDTFWPLCFILREALVADQWFLVIWILSLALWTPAGKTMVIFVNYWPRIIFRNHGLRTPNEAFTIEINFWAWEDELGN